MLNLLNKLNLFTIVEKLYTLTNLTIPIGECIYVAI